MADMYNNTACSSPSSPPEPDDFSLFLHQVLLRSSSSPSFMAYRAPPLQPTSILPTQPSLSSGLDRRVTDPISVADSSSGLIYSSGAVGFSSVGGHFPASAPNVSSSSVGTIDNDPDEYDCESEEGFEALVGEVPAKPVPPRNSSKRSRAAEVHNLSEKRRRSRINEKMKALQNLIPNSNKTDKASMLDEAIEYLKQLQLQVQMLTMRNGLSLYPMCLPGVLQPAELSQINMGFLEGNTPLNIDIAGLPPVDQENSPNVPNQTTNTAQSGPGVSTVINSGTSFGLGSSVQGPVVSAQLHISSVVENIFRNDVLPHQQLHASHSQTSLPGMEMVGIPTTSTSCEAQSSHRKDDAVLEACVPGSQRPKIELLTNLQSDPILATHFNSMCARKTTEEDAKDERLNF